MKAIDLRLEGDLAEAGGHRRVVEAQRSEASADLRHLVHEANDRGWPKTKIAQAAGISRQTVHEMLREGKGRR